MTYTYSKVLTNFRSHISIKSNAYKIYSKPCLCYNIPNGPWRVSTEVDIKKNHTNNSGESKTANKFNNLKNSTVKNNSVKRQL